MRFKRAVLCWEIGGGRGHLIRLGVAADALRSLGIECTAAVVVRQEFANEISNKVGRVLPTPKQRSYTAQRRSRGLPLAATYGEWLADNGMFAADFILNQVIAWRAIFDQEKPDLVICNQAPYAILAAKSLGIATSTIGNWFSVPPTHYETYPAVPFRELRKIWHEPQIVDAINAAMSAFGGPSLTFLPQIYACDVPLCCSLDFLDLFNADRRVPLVPSITQPVRNTDGPHNEVFVYYAVADRHDPVMLTAIMKMPVPVRAFIPGIDAELTALLRGRGVIVETSPVPIDDMIGRTRVALHAGAHGIVSLCLRTGLPFVGVPRIFEPELNTRRCAERGAAIAVLPHERTVPKVRDAVMAIYEDQAYQDNARKLAAELAPQFARDPMDVIAERVAAA